MVLANLTRSYENWLAKCYRESDTNFDVHAWIESDATYENYIEHRRNTQASNLEVSEAHFKKMQIALIQWHLANIMHRNPIGCRRFLTIVEGREQRAADDFAISEASEDVEDLPQEEEEAVPGETASSASGSKLIKLTATATSAATGAAIATGAIARAATARAKKAALRASDHLERSEGWNGLHAGDAVVVSGLSMRGASWSFRAHIVNTNNGSESVEVVGGRPGDRMVRSFGPERIFAVTAAGRRRSSAKAVAGELSLAEAPQLPLG